MNTISNQILASTTIYYELNQRCKFQSELSKTILKVVAVCFTLFSIGIVPVAVKTGCFFYRLFTVNYPCKPFSYRIDVKGIRNMGSTCFMNTAFQILAAMPGIEEILNFDLIKNSKESDKDFNERKKIKEHLSTLIFEIKKEKPSKEVIENCVITMGQSYLVACRFTNFPKAPGDLSEFLSLMMDFMEFSKSKKHALRIKNTPSAHPGDVYSIIPLYGIVNQPSLSKDGTHLSMQELFDSNFDPIYKEKAQANQIDLKKVEHVGRYLLNTQDPDLIESVTFTQVRFDQDRLQHSTRKVIDVLKRVEIVINGQKVLFEPQTIGYHIHAHYVALLKQPCGNWKEMDDNQSCLLTPRQAEEKIIQTPCLINYRRVASNAKRD